MDITQIFCDIDDFCNAAEKTYEHQFPGDPGDPWTSQLALSEVMSILVFFHRFNGFRHFKAFYSYVRRHMSKAFPKLVSYTRFVTLIKQTCLPLFFYLQTRLGSVTGIAFVDSTKIVVCHNKRINSNKVFKDLAARGKSTMGWFYGFKLHLITNDKGELLSFDLTPGNTDDRVPIPGMTQGLWGRLFGDKGYISKALTQALIEKKVRLVTPIKKNMKNKLIPIEDKVLLRKRSIIETINDLLKNSCCIDHTRHRSPMNFLVNLIAGLIGYTYRDKMPEIHFSNQDLELLADT
ncbi:MAG: IS982 family transposase [Cocleimonas sp.]|nr:IS982 family transposase [Cocleimonas sp.]